MNKHDPAQDRSQDAAGPVSVREAVRHLLPESNADPSPRCDRAFTVAGEAWIACIAGQSAVGTGTRGHAFLTAIHFCRADAPDQPLREALLPRGRFQALFEEELCTLLGEARPIAVRASERR